MAISPQDLNTGELVSYWLQQAVGSLLIRWVGSQHFDRQQMALRIHQHVPFAPPDFFSPDRSPFEDHEPHWF